MIQNMIQTNMKNSSIMKTQILAVSLAALALTACNKKEADTPQTIVDPVAMASFTADVRTASAGGANAAGTAFSEGDKVGIVPVKSSGVDTPQYNTPYTFDGTQFTANPPYWFRDRSSVTFNAYYPYSDDISADGAISIDTKAENQKAAEDGWRINDILFASASTDVSAPTVAYTGEHAFTHQLSKLTLTFKAGDGIDNLSDLQNYTIGSLVTEGDFNAVTGELSLKTGAVPENLTMTVSGSAATDFTALPLILLPQTLSTDALKLSVTFNGQIYNASLSLPGGLEAGKHYTFNITIRSTPLGLITPEIVDWETVAGGDTDAKMPDEL